MARSNTSTKPRPSTTQAAPQGETGVSGTGGAANDSNGTDVVESHAVHLAETSRPVSKGNLFAKKAEEKAAEIAQKLTLMGSVRQRLAHAADLFREGGDKDKEATEIAAEAAKALYQARIGGVLSPDEVSGALGDVFGYKPKADGTPGKTPAGQGEAIRKRVVRAAQATDYVTGGDGGAFFTGLPEDEVSQVIREVENGTLSIYTAYDKFGEIKRGNATRVDPAFDPKRIGAIVEKLSEKGAAERLRASPSLITAYAALIDVLNVLGEESAETA
jgi:hypothetical protein